MLNVQKEQLAIGGEFYFEHYRNGKLIDSGKSHNLFVNEGLKYALNASFGVPVGGAPSQIANMYIGLSTANRNWAAGDIADTIHTVGLEFEDYDELVRQEWLPQALATTSSLTLTNSGAEATFTISADDTIYGAFIIDNNVKEGTSDTTSSILVAGSNFTAARVLYIDDVFKVGYSLTVEAGA